MKAIVAALFVTATAAFADTDYVVKVSGMSCAGCKAHVREAFSKLEGVKADSIRIEAATEKGQQKITFTSSSEGLTKDLAVKSLGDAAKRYVVERFEKAEPATKG